MLSQPSMQFARRRRDDPHVEVAIGGGPRRPMTARVAEGDERTELWSKLTADHANYAGYQRKTDREIPVVVLDPAPSGA